MGNSGVIEQELASLYDIYWPSRGVHDPDPHRAIKHGPDPEAGEVVSLGQILLMLASVAIPRRYLRDTVGGSPAGANLSL